MRLSKPYVIAEIGVNFYDTARVMNIFPLDAAKKYIDAAVDVGVTRNRHFASICRYCYWTESKDGFDRRYHTHMGDGMI